MVHCKGMQNNNSEKTPSTSRKNLIISGVLILVVLGALIAAPRLKNSREEVASLEQEVAEVATTAETARALSRADATQKYASALLSFSGEDCAVAPKDAEFPLYTTIMLDNGTNVRRAITVGEKSYSVGAERYTLSWLNMGVGTYPVTCDGKEVGTVVIK